MNPPANREVTLFSAALELPASQRDAYLDEACADDPPLRQRLHALLGVHQEAIPFLKTPALGAQEVVALIANTQTKPPAMPKRFGDYELLEEIARGGMGVVFKARQVGLNRLVAVKMILAGEFASKEFVRRFRAEAEAVASLQHPNIVVIHEVGEHEGQHYFSMDYVDGKNLAELVRSGPLSARRAATYLKLIAEGIHYAHQTGILHRDLKPSNILIDQFDQPHITDFGLAKRLSSASDLGRANSGVTMTGQVLGSPNYMSPEQAEGKHRETTVASDVYSLGAILYHLLVGRPPFSSEALEETLAAVRSQDPVPPRVLNSSIPADLETICLKCLEKATAQRYASAQVLAEELGRFLNGEPIRTQPVTLTTFSHTLWADLNYSEAYREHADEIIPERRYVFHVLRSFFRHFLARDSRLRVCDLGCGDGSLAQQLLASDATIGLTLVDGSSQMLDAARRRLGDQSGVHFVQATFDALIQGAVDIGRFEFVVSSLAIHHLAQAERAALFHRVFELLQPGGWFLNFDTVLPDRSVFTNWHYELWREWIIQTEKHSRPAGSFRDKPDEARRNPDNKLSPLTVQLKALQAVGFVDVDCHYRNGIFAIYCGLKP